MKKLEKRLLRRIVGHSVLKFRDLDEGERSALAELEKKESIRKPFARGLQTDWTSGWKPEDVIEITRYGRESLKPDYAKWATYLSGAGIVVTILIAVFS